MRLIGVPEKAEVSNPADFFEQWFACVIGKDCLSPARLCIRSLGVIPFFESLTDVMDWLD